MESMKLLISSPDHNRDLATLVVAYGISINLVEVAWKLKLHAQIRFYVKNSNIRMMLLSQFIFDKYGWGGAARITPTVLLLTGVGFFSLILFSDPLVPALAKFGMTPLLAAVYVGAMQNIFSKDRLQTLPHTSEAYSDHCFRMVVGGQVGDFSTGTGIATFAMMLLSQFIFDKYGWGGAARITPTVLLLTGVGFFSLILFSDPLVPALAKFGMTPLLAAVYVGAMQNIFSKGAKYSLFYPCKEMAYSPLDEETRFGIFTLNSESFFKLIDHL
ncbi:plastidic ATP/ADP-transporter-like [Hibiscus syriacus]|uniref:plastidic ATP/ADP-transporter-like n=1 Tax=Hibiscus syriacus TaxID=106335 RepID=UPI00192321B9|nr:plastidic ATP/ADP-transporter-like [Hibiscus syriacus]